jgi:hypothetical protein
MSTIIGTLMFMLGLLLLSSAQAQLQLPKVPDVLKGVGGQSSGGLSEPRAASPWRSRRYLPITPLPLRCPY